MTVTRKNRQLYVDLYVHYLLTDKVTKQFNSFANGFSKVCNVISIVCIKVLYTLF